MNDNRHTTTIRTQARALRQRWLQHLLALLCLLTAGGAGEAWATVTTIYERGGSGTAWSAADLTDWTANVANTLSIDGGLKASGGNNGYWSRKAVTVNPNSKLTITATWNTGSSLGRPDGYNYLSFGNVELRAYGQGSKGTIVINGEETVLTNQSSDVRDNKDWTISLTITQATGDVSYTITPPSGAKSGSGNAGVLGFSDIEMGYVKVGSISNTRQTLKAISISEELYNYTVSATGSISQTIATGIDGPSATVTTPYHHYILSGTTLHKAAPQGSNPHYGKVFTLDEDNKSAGITYSQVNIDGSESAKAKNYALFREAEDFLTRVDDNSYVNIRCSGTQGGYASSYTTIATLPSGAYKITAASYAKATNYDFRIGDSYLWTHVSDAKGAWTENSSDILQFPVTGDFQVTGGKAQYPLDYVMVERLFAYVAASSDRTKGETHKPDIVNNLEGYTVTYSSNKEEIATVNGTSGDVTFKHNGRAIITATATKAGSPTYTTTHTVIITGETAATETWDTSVEGQETYTLSGTGFVDQKCEGTHITMEYGSANADETQTVDVGNAHCIDAGGFWHAHLSGGTTGLPDMGTYYAFTPKDINGTLTINGLVTVDGDKRNGLRLMDSDGNVIERITTIGNDYQDYAFNTLLMAGKTYYVLAETDAMDEKKNTAYSTLCLHSFKFTKMSGETISLIDQSLLFTTETNANNNQLDRIIPKFEVKFGGGDGAKYTGGGLFIIRNAAANSEDQNGEITIIPRIADRTDVTFTSVTINTGAKPAGVSDNPAIYVIKENNTEVTFGEEKTVTHNGTTTIDLTGKDVHELTIKLKGKTETKNKLGFHVNSITFVYSVSEGKALDETKGNVSLKFKSDLIYDYTGENVENDFWIDSPVAFTGNVTFIGNVAKYGNGYGFSNGNTEEPYQIWDANNLTGEGARKTHYGANMVDDNSDRKPDSFEKYKVHIGQGVCLLQASTEETSYFKAGYAEARLYSRDYVEEHPVDNLLILAKNETYTVPAADGLSFAITTNGGTITLTGTADTPDDALSSDERFLTTATGSAVTIKNTGASDITIKKIEVYRKQGTLSFAYDGLVGEDNDVAFEGESYMPTDISVTGEEGIAAKYDSANGTYTIAEPQEGVSVNATTGELTLGSEVSKGIVLVTMTVNPRDAYKADYAPISATIPVKVTDGMWDFRTYSRTEHLTMYNSPGWGGQSNGYYSSRDIADFDYILCNDGTPLLRALGLKSMGKHRILHSDKGYLHLQGKGVGAYQSPNGGGQLLVPAKAGMLVEVNAYSEDLLSEMEIEGVTTLDGNVVSTFLVDPLVGSTPPESQYFLAQSDGYIVIKNPSFNLELHVRYVKVSAEMAFEFGNETYVDAAAASGTFANRVMNKGETIITSSFQNTRNTPISNDSDYTTTNETFTLSRGYGIFTVESTGHGSGLLKGKTGTYTATALAMNISVDPNESIGAEGKKTYTVEDRVTIDTGNTFQTGTDSENAALKAAAEAEIKKKITYSIVGDAPNVSMKVVGDQHQLTIEGTGTYTVRATLGSFYKDIVYTVTGGSLKGGLNPVIESDADSYTIEITGSVASPTFNLAQMKADTKGDIKASIESLTFKDGSGSIVTSSETVTGTKLTISGFNDINKGGVIPIYATYTYGGYTHTIRGTLTIAYTSHVWRFQHNLLTGMDATAEVKEETACGLASGSLNGYGSEHGLVGGIDGWQTGNGSKTATWDVTYATVDEPTDEGTHKDNYNWKFVRKIGGHNTSSMVYYYNHPVEGDNALVIPETEGLHINASPTNRQLGVEIYAYGSNDDEVKAGTKTTGEVKLIDGGYYASNIMLLRGGRITIPKVKKGQWVEVRWTRHKEDEAERMLMYNLSDFEGTPITSTYKIGNCFYDQPWSTSTYMFQATDDGDVTFEIADNIYISIQQIELHAPSWDPISSIVTQLNGYDYPTTYTTEEISEKASTVTSHWSGSTPSASDKIKWQYVWDDQGSHTVTFLPKAYQNAPNAPQKWSFEMDEMLTRSGAEMIAVGPDDSEATLTYRGGWGKVKITMTCYSQNMKYVANKKTWNITFGQAPRQTYPYTWDFTKYFDTTESGIGTDSWSNGTPTTTKTAIYPNYNTQNYTTSYYVEGAQLVSYALRGTNNGVLRETDGLGFKLDTDANGMPDASLSLDMQSAASSRSADGPYRAPTTGNGELTLTGGTIIVPRPGSSYNDYYVYIKSSVEPTFDKTVVKKCVSSVSDATSEELDDNHDVGSGRYKYHFQKDAHAEFTFNSDVTVYAIGVTDMFKPMTKLGSTAWATESRNRTIDHTLTGVLTTNPTDAYVVIERTGNPVYSDDMSKTTVSVSDQREVVPAGHGLIMKQTSAIPAVVADGSTYTVPLFVPAVTTATDADYRFANNLMRPSIDATTFSSETQDYDGSAKTDGTADSDGTDYTRFILAKRYMTWKRKGDELTKPTAYESGAAAAFYRMHLYDETDISLIDEFSSLTTSEQRAAKATELNTLPANSAYLLLRTARINDPIWNSTGGSSRQWAGIEGISDFADEDTLPDDATPASSPTYNMRGQAVDTTTPLPPGIYIRNGRKIIVR